ncbi:MAG: hypothetical protein M3P50_11540 [Actinomycetota bacterium]|nr:hypothetical protein [Actinomycetota bacterium]
MTTERESSASGRASDERTEHSYSLSLTGAPGSGSPAAQALDETIDASIEGRRLYPDGSMFISADEPQIGRAIAIAVDENRPVVLCFADGRRYVLHPASPAGT